MPDDLPPLVPRTEAQERRHQADLDQRAADYRANAARAEEKRRREAEAAKRAHDALPEVKAARMKANEAIRRKLHAKQKVTTDAVDSALTSTVKITTNPQQHQAALTGRIPFLRPAMAVVVLRCGVRWGNTLRLTVDLRTKNAPPNLNYNTRAA